MSYDSWKTTPPDDDPEGEQHRDDAAENACPDCGAPDGDECAHDCGCSHCRAREWQQQDQPPPLQEAMSDADLDEHESYMAEIAAQERNTDG